MKLISNSLVAASVTASALFLSSSAGWALDNGGFEDGFNHWTASDPAAVEIFDFLNTEVVDFDDGDAGVKFLSIDGDFFAGLANGAEDVFNTLSQTFTVGAGAFFTGYFAFVTDEDEDDLPSHNDDAYVSLIDAANNVINLLSFAASDAQPGNSVGWTKVVHTFAAGGEYTLEIGVRNIGDDSKLSGVLVDAVSVTAVPGPVAGAGLPAIAALGALLLRRRRG